MFNWFGSSSCTVDPITRQWIERRWRWLTDEFGSDVMIDAPNVLPSEEFFPDKYDRSDDAVRTLTRRVCQYMGVEASQIDLQFYNNLRRPYLVNEAGDGIGEAVGTYHQGDSRFVVRLERSAFEQPMALVATIAHELAHVRLLGEGRIGRDEFDNELLTDLTTVFMGMGIFRANSPGYHLARSAHWPGTDVPKPEYMTTPMYGYALAYRCWLREEPLPKWRRHLGPGVRAEFKQALRFLQTLTS
ncbi:MAG TPA: hypothetical protein VFE47_16860 [Tepidisphaeraceae bacterium]|jgi:hypothetical protein|nr:hypothetical protein [Tepidisphaeraceae bacterium]